MDIQNTSFYVASIMATRKEQAIKAAILHHFGDSKWDENTLEKHAGINVDPDGTETFFIGQIELVRFGPLESKIDIEGDRVMLLFNQPILEIY